MKFKKVSISNFRKLKEISFECADTINTIVGPNGVGKSSILDAIRILKAILLPTTETEAQTTLQHMGLFSPHVGDVLYESICGDNTKDCIIDIKVELTIEEIQRVNNEFGNFAVLRLQNQLGKNSVSRLNLVGYLSTSQGNAHLKKVQDETTKLLADIQKNYTAQLKLTISKNQISGFNGFHQELVSYLFKSPVFSETLFTVFPADRNFPSGDVNIQLGQNEVNQQLQSYSVQPQTKFTRLKAAMVSYLMINSNNIESIQNDFKLIFDNLIPGKELQGINMEQRTGKLSVLIKETETRAIYDIDFLSSGEKGLLLTLFLLLRTVRQNGLILLDEPELHLNPAVCQNIIPFLKEFICKKKNAQFILTTHSAEVLATTKDDEQCRLLHLINETTISPIYKKDNEEAQEAIKCLGITTSDLLFNNGVIYLEGTTDDDYINETLKGIANGYKVQSLGGRTVVENEIKTLQEADSKKELQGYHIFVLDNDNKPTSLKSSENVKVLQWDRYSFENYLLNLDVLYDVIKSLSPTNFPSNREEFYKAVKKMAFIQIEPLSVFAAMESLFPKTASITKKEIKGLALVDISKLLSGKIETQKLNLNSFDATKWEKEYTELAEKKTKETKGVWEENWKIKCRGKELLTSLHNEFKPLISYKAFIKHLIVSNRSEDSEEWKILKSKIQPVLNTTR